MSYVRPTETNHTIGSFLSCHLNDIYCHQAVSRCWPIPWPHSLSTSEQQLRIATNRHAALQKRRARRLQVVQSIPVLHHIYGDSQEDSDVVRPLRLTTHQTSSHRNKFAFGRISATQARQHCAVRASDSSAEPQASHDASACSVFVLTDPCSLPLHHVQRDCQDDSHQCAIRAIDCSGGASASSVSVPTDPDPLLQEPVQCMVLVLPSGSVWPILVLPSGRLLIRSCMSMNLDDPRHLCMLEGTHNKHPRCIFQGTHSENHYCIVDRNHDFFV